VYGLLLAGVLLQGLSPVFTKLLLRADLAQATIVATRYLLAAAFFLPLLPLERRAAYLLPPRRRDWIAVIAAGLLGSGVAALLFAWALTYTTAGVALAISKTAPLFVAVLAYLALHEGVTPGRAALVGAMVLADVLMGAGDFSLGGPQARVRLIGDLLALGAGGCRALSEVLAKGALRRFSPAAVGAWRVAMGFVLAAVVAPLTGDVGKLAHLPGWGWAVLVALALVSTTGSLLLYYRGLAHIPVHVAVALKLLSVVVTVVLSWFWLGEALNAYHLTGIVILLAGAYLLVAYTPAHVPHLAAARRAGPARPLRARLGQVRVRLTLTAGLVIVAVVVPATYLMAAHATYLVRRETRLAMSNVAVTVLNELAAHPRSRVTTEERFLRNLVNAKLEDESYSVDVVFALVQDIRGMPLAAAYEQQALALGTSGTGPVSRGQMLAALTQLSADNTLAAQYGLIVVQATLDDPANPLTVTLGCKREAAGRLVAQIIARHVVVALLIILASVGSLWVALGRATQPLSAVFRAVDHVSRGSLRYPVVARSPDEVGQMAQAVDQIRLALLRGRQWRSVALRLLEQARVEPAALPEGLVYMALPAPTSTGEGTEQEAAAWVLLLEEVLEEEGAVEGTSRGSVIVSWGRAGAEQDDYLRALVTGWTLAGAVGERGGALPAIAHSPRAVLEEVPGGALSDFAGPHVWVDAQDLAALEPALQAGEFRVVGATQSGRRWLAVAGVDLEEEALEQAAS
jgi:drug/metabolite transporter (DMT)-like permease/HAMP domain-containing protein